MKDSAVEMPIRVIGRNTSNFQISVWYFDDEKMALSFAKVLASDTGLAVEICRLLGTLKCAPRPVEYHRARQRRRGK